MSFRAQKLLNNFPSWSKARRDRSSVASRVFDSFSTYFDFAHAELVKLKDYNYVLKEGLGHPFVNVVHIDPLAFTVSKSGKVIWEYPTVTADAIELTRVEYLEDLFWSVPTRISELETIAIASFDASSGVIDKPDKLLVRVSGSDTFEKYHPITNPLCPNRHQLIISGKDINGIAWIEHLKIPDDDIYRTENIWSEIDSVEEEGFDGDIELWIHSALGTVKDRYRLGVTDRVEGDLKLNYSYSDYSYLTFYTDIIKSGVNYRTGTVPDVNTDEIWESNLTDLDGLTFEIVDLAINPNSLRYYAVDTDGVIHVYEPNIAVFSPNSLPYTKESVIEIQPLKPSAIFNEEMRLFTWFEKPLYPINSVQIRRVSPSNIVNYLQSDKTWGVGAYSFPYSKDPETALPEETWQDITFNSVFDEFGQWEFYCDARCNGTTYTSFSAVLCEELRSVADFETGLEATGIYFDHADRLCICTANSIVIYQEFGDYYLASEKESLLYLREDYDSVDVT